jgi:hypothetical protein
MIRVDVYRVRNIAMVATSPTAAESGVENFG